MKQHLKNKNSVKKNIFDLEDLSDIPEEIVALVLIKTVKTTENITSCIIGLLKERNVLSLAEICIGLYRKHKIIRPLSMVAALLSPHLRRGRISTNFKGVYTYKDNPNT